jgi:uncharacterized protein (DUF58 family)
VIEQADLFKNIARIEITAKKFALELFSGMYASRFRGRGIEVEDIREFQTGDDFRAIDWQRTAQMGKPYVKNFRQERDLTVLLLVDVSGSCDFASSAGSKREMQTKMAALLAICAAHNHDRVGLMLFSEDVEKSIRPGRGIKHVMRILRELLSYKPKERKTNIERSLDTFNRVIKKRGICFLFSDFLDDNFEKSLARCAKKHDTIAVHVRDAGEIENVAPCMVFEDLETGKSVFVSSQQEVLEYIQKRKEQYERANHAARKTKAEWIDIQVQDSPVQKLAAYFRLRKKRLG